MAKSEFLKLWVSNLRGGGGDYSEGVGGEARFELLICSTTDKGKYTSMLDFPQLFLTASRPLIMVVA
jgi:hypothetical protein